VNSRSAFGSSASRRDLLARLRALVTRPFLSVVVVLALALGMQKRSVRTRFFGLTQLAAWAWAGRQHSLAVFFSASLGAYAALSESGFFYSLRASVLV
jgi:hypothetical protein